MSVMRTNLWTGLVQTLSYNINRQQGRVRIFEQGLRFFRDDSGIVQENVVAGLLYGSVLPEQWGAPQRGVDFYDIKGDVEALLALNGSDNFSFMPDQHPALHPGQTASILRDGDAVGWVGALHPEVIKNIKITSQVFVFEILSNAIYAAARLPAYHELSKFPAIRRDIALVVEDAVTVQAINNCIKNISSEILQDLQLFDMFKGKGIDSGKKSLALSLVLQHHSRTLTDEEVDAFIQHVVTVLEEELKVKLRD
jgi:phenylalanyl-tRNA synthetase beta chain